MWDGCFAKCSVDTSVSRRVWTLLELHQAGLHPSMEVHTTHFAREGKRLVMALYTRGCVHRCPMNPATPSTHTHTHNTSFETDLTAMTPCA